jgi:hypothetical protein
VTPVSKSVQRSGAAHSPSDREPTVSAPGEARAPRTPPTLRSTTAARPALTKLRDRAEPARAPRRRCAQAASAAHPPPVPAASRFPGAASSSSRSLIRIGCTTTTARSKKSTTTSGSSSTKPLRARCAVPPWAAPWPKTAEPGSRWMRRSEVDPPALPMPHSLTVALPAKMAHVRRK